MAALITVIICFTVMVITIVPLWMAYDDQNGRSIHELIFGRKYQEKAKKTEV